MSRCWTTTKRAAAKQRRWRHTLWMIALAVLTGQYDAGADLELVANIELPFVNE